MTKWTKRFIAVAFVGLVFVASYYFGFFRSGAFGAAEAYAKSSASIRSRVGEVDSVFMDPFSSSFSFSGLRGHVEMTLRVSGAKGHAKLVVVLNKDVGPWEVSAASVDTQRIDIEKP